MARRNLDPDPLFHLEGIFIKEEIYPDQYYTCEVPRFFPDTSGKINMLDKFDPICHLEIEENKNEEEEEQLGSEDLDGSIDAISENSMPHKR